MTCWEEESTDETGKAYARGGDIIAGQGYGNQKHGLLSARSGEGLSVFLFPGLEAFLSDHLCLSERSQSGGHGPQVPAPGAADRCQGRA